MSLCYRNTAGNNREREVEGMHHAEWHMKLTNNMGSLLVFKSKDNVTVSHQTQPATIRPMNLTH